MMMMMMIIIIIIINNPLSSLIFLLYYSYSKYHSPLRPNLAYANFGIKLSGNAV